MSTPNDRFKIKCRNLIWQYISPPADYVKMATYGNISVTMLLLLILNTLVLKSKDVCPLRGGIVGMLTFRAGSNNVSRNKLFMFYSVRSTGQDILLIKKV